ncbi:putative phage protein (TIGR02216 family) [Defluviimonas denitrificans]|jgi:uncharacterized phage protein (TIGR02216 family)|uniref:Putative phage protein (TIGR02216 family) n=1 Tax=Albidovulum denitrificans TaxID=404881 RepID=A0A2S8SAN8_9RHOB|nr:rcc01693 family protein [Defluviimonas denitrificans]PQV57819.1 putative phage protein (TIGR02216 family) [Defluviimonas denitrificans]
MSAFDWPGLMRAGMGSLGLHPEQFWKLTPAELVLMLGDPAAVAPLDRARLSELARAWPDEIKEDEDGTDRRAGRLGPAGDDA